MAALLRGVRGIVAAALAVITALGWLYLLYSPMPMVGPAGWWEPAYIGLSFAMWSVMMVAMMTPSVIPVVLLYDRIMHGGQSGWHRRTAAFVCGYLLAWASFSLLATLAQAALIGSGAVDAMGKARSSLVSAALLLAVALYQFSPLKAACVERCQSPLEVITRRRRAAFRHLRAGLAHGAWCVGCCWSLMLLLFVGGVMNLGWVAVITVIVALEKLAPDPQRVRRLLGWLALGAALWLALGGALTAVATWGNMTGLATPKNGEQA